MNSVEPLGNLEPAQPAAALQRATPAGTPAAAPTVAPAAALTRPARQRQATAGTDAKRERILRSAEALFHEQGYALTTIEQIAERLGVTKPYVYYYFHGKQQLFETLSWAPAVACFTVLDDPALAALPAHEQAAQAIERLIRATLAHYPAAFFAYREPQAYRAEFLAAQKALAQGFYARLVLLLERGRAEGRLDFDDAKVTALAACSLPGFLYTWYRPEGRLPPEALVRTLASLAWRVIGLQRG